jgi:hypothetical protein
LRRVCLPPRRLLALGAAVIVGVVGALALAAPASAHHPIFATEVECGPTPTTVIIKWRVDNSETDKEATLSEVSPEVGGISNGARLLPSADHAYQPLTGEQRVDIADQSVTMRMHVRWSNGFNGDFEHTVRFDGQVCGETQVGFEDRCDGTTTVELKNGTNVDVRFVVEATGNWHKDAPVPAGKTATEVVPAANAALVQVKKGTEVIGRHEREQPQNCGKPALTHKSDCDNLTLTVENPQGGAPVDVSVKVGDRVETMTVQPGDNATKTIAGKAGLVATVTVGGEVTEVQYVKPASCGSLPVTGADVGRTAALALVLVFAGAGLFVAFRRRRIRFTA